MVWLVFITILLLIIIVAIVKIHNKGKQIGGFGSIFPSNEALSILSRKTVVKNRKLLKMSRKKKEIRSEKKG